MSDIFTFLSSSQLKLLLIIFAAFAIFFVTTGRQLLQLIRLSRKICGPSSWETFTVYGVDIWKNQLSPFIADMTKKYNYLPWGAWAGLNYYIFISDPDTIRDAFRSKNLKDKSDIAYSVLHDNFEHNVLTSNKEEWKRRRLLYRSSFKKSFLEPRLHIINEEAGKAIEKLRHYPSETDFDIRHLIDYSVVQVVMKTVLCFDDDDNFDQKEADDALSLIRSLFAKAMTHFVKPNLFNLFYLWSKKVDFNKNNDLKAHLHKKCSSLVDTIAQRLMEDHYSKIEGPMEAIVSDNLRKQTLTRDEIVSDMFILFGAATDTTSTTLMAVVYMLALHQEVQERASEEVRRVFGESNGPMVAEDLARLEYLERVIKESLRLFPPVPRFLRTVAEDTNLNGTLVPKGANAVFDVFLLHRNPSNFKDPLKFDPDRFLQENQKLQHQYAYLPFSSGSRDCMGKVFAMFKMKIFLSKLLQKYKVLPGQGMNCIGDIKWEWCFTMIMNENFVRLVPLSDNVS